MATKKQPQDRKPSSAADFKKRVRTTLELPSGLVVKVKNPGGMQAYLSQGKIPNTLLPLVQQGIKQGGVDQAEVGKAIEDPAAIADMLDLVNTMVIDTCVEPRVYPAPEDEDDRDDDLVYIDEMSDSDRMFIFNWVNSGVTDLARFRQ